MRDYSAYMYAAYGVAIGAYVLYTVSLMIRKRKVRRQIESLK